MEQTKNSNKMGVMPINKLMLAMGTPMILSMVLQAFYNIVDSAFVSNMAVNGEAALNALTLAFPLQMLMIAISIGTGVGTNALLAKSLGQDNRDKANKAAGNALFMAVIIYIIFLLFGLFGVDFYISTQTNNLLIAQMAISYLQICCILSFGIIFFSIYEKLLQATGHSMYSTISQIAGAVSNIILDPILIFGWFGCPMMGVQGAAYATVIGQCISVAVALFFHLRVNKEISNGFQYMKPSIKVIKEIYTIGFPAIIAQALMSLMTYTLNIILGSISEAMVTAYGLFYKIQQFILFAAFGLRDAITPIISYNHGKRSKKRIIEGMKYGMLYTIIIMFIGMLVLEIFAVPFSEIFGLSGETQDLCISAIHIISISFIFAGANIAFQGIFQALEGGIESLIISICRQFLFVIPIAYAFAKIAVTSPENTWLVWTTFPIAELSSAAIACLLLKKVYHKQVKILQD